MARLWPDSLFGRMLVVLLIGVLLAQVVSNAIWVNRLNKEKEIVAERVAQDLAQSVASTIVFFESLPSQYRHVVLSQLRDMGGTRYFVSLNKELINIADIENSKLKSIVIYNFTQGLRKRIGNETDINVSFSKPQNLHAFNNDTLLQELPPHWSQRSLIYESDSLPVLVAQVAMEEGEWLYLAALLPRPDLLKENDYLPLDRLLFLVLLLIIMAVMSALVVRWLTQPMKKLVEAAELLGREIEVPPLEEKGPKEIQLTARAFNRMQYRIHRFIEDRERLFSAISHDLKTPITRLRLRAEMLEDESDRSQFCRNLEELDRMVTGALECSRGVDIHEKVRPIDMMALLQSLQDDVELEGKTMIINGDTGPAYLGRPLALKRCLRNLIDNAIFYGREATVDVSNNSDQLCITVKDQGPGIPEEAMVQVFEPYYRIEASRNRYTGGTGLGLGIARNIIHAHGGEIELSNSETGGLIVRLSLPRH